MKGRSIHTHQHESTPNTFFYRNGLQAYRYRRSRFETCGADRSRVFVLTLVGGIHVQRLAARRKCTPFRLTGKAGSTEKNNQWKVPQNAQQVHS